MFHVHFLGIVMYGRYDFKPSWFDMLQPHIIICVAVFGSLLIFLVFLRVDSQRFIVLVDLDRDLFDS